MPVNTRGNAACKCDCHYTNKIKPWVCNQICIKCDTGDKK